MLNFAVISGYRYFNGYRRNVIYLGNVTEDGWIYFQDDTSWRYAPDADVVQLFYYDKQIWVNTNNMEIDGVFNFNAIRAQNTINGAGSVAPNANVETAVKWAIEKCNAGNVTYSMSDRNVKNPNAYSYDCSSFIITAFYVGGFDGDISQGSATPQMRAMFEDMGFRWIPYNFTVPVEDCIRGDILLNEYPGVLGHTNIYIGNNQCADCGGDAPHILQYTEDNWGSGWHGILRYEG